MTVGESFVSRRKAPSIDRIDCTKGYVEGNVRLVWAHANFARNQFGDAAFFELCEAGAKARWIDVLPLEDPDQERSLFDINGRAARFET